MCDVTKKKDHIWLKTVYATIYFIYIWKQPIATYSDKY